MTRASILVSCLLSVLVTGISATSARAEQPLPPNVKYRGKTVAEWSLLHNEWAIGTGLGEGSLLPDTIKKMRFLPPGFGPGDFEFDVVVPPGTGIVSSPFFVFGELYEDGSADDPDELADVLELILMLRTIEVRLDGEVVQSGTAEELSAMGYGYGPTFFDAPIPYAEPQDRGGIFAIAALWTIGVGGVYHPMTPGQHSLVVESDGPFFGPNSFTYNITVEK